MSPKKKPLKKLASKAKKSKAKKYHIIKVDLPVDVIDRYKKVARMAEVTLSQAILVVVCLEALKATERRESESK